jgi:hypothetical protein
LIGPAAILFGIAIPALVAGIVLFVDARLRARGSPACALHLGSLALGGGYLIAHAWLVGAPKSPLGQDALPFTSWIFWLVAIAVLLAPLRGIPAIARWMRVLYVAAFCVSMRRVIQDPGPDEGADVVLAFGGVLLVYVLWTALERLAERRPGAALPAALWAACAGTSLTLLLNRSGSLAQLVGAVCAGLGAAVVVACLVRGTHLARGAVAIVVIVAASAVRVAVVYDLPAASWALLAVAFAGPWLGEIPALRARAPRTADVASFLGAAVPAGAAALLTWSSREPSPY